MKKLNFLYVIISLSILAFSCNKDDDPKVDTVVGKWDLDNVKVEIMGNTTLSQKYNGTYIPFSFYGGVTRRILDIKQDKTFDFETRLYDGNKFNDEGKWVKTNTILTLKYDSSDDEEFTIVSSETDALKLSIELNEQWRNPSDTSKTISANTKYTYNYSK